MAKSINQRCNAFTTILGLFAHSSNTAVRIVKMLSNAGLSISPTSIDKAIDSLSNEGKRRPHSVVELVWNGDFPDAKHPSVMETRTSATICQHWTGATHR